MQVLGIVAITRRLPEEPPSNRSILLGQTVDPVIGVRGTLGRLIEGKPGFILSPACVELRKALAGRYCYRRVQVGSDERYEDKPSKNRYSHIADALQYALLGSGMGREVLGRKKRERVGPPPQRAPMASLGSGVQRRGF